MLPREWTKSDPAQRLSQRWQTWLYEYVPGVKTKESIDVIETTTQKDENKRKINLFVSIEEPCTLGELFPANRRFSPSCIGDCNAVVSNLCAETMDFRYEDLEYNVESGVVSFVELYAAVFAGALVRQPFRGVNVSSCKNVLFIFQGADPVKVERTMKAELKKVFGKEDLQIHDRVVSLIWVDSFVLQCREEGPPQRFVLEEDLRLNDEDVSSSESDGTIDYIPLKRTDNKRSFEDQGDAVPVIPKKAKV